VSDVKVQQKQSLSRQEAARLIAALAEGLREDGKVTVQLGNSTLELSVTDHVDWELEVEVDGDEIELEIELKWSTSGRATAEAAENDSEEDQSVEDESAGVESEQDESEDLQPELVSGETEAEEPETERDALAEDEAAAGESGEDAPEFGDAEEAPADDPDWTPQPRSGRRNTATRAGKPASNGIDTAAVRAWAAANGLNVSPRGRIKDEVIQAYRAAGN
jgi:amphi-Trp domain-containing protein